MELKTHQVHRLPTEDTTDIQRSKTTNKFFYKINNTFEKVYQHLYFTNDEEIKEGDWFLDSTMTPKNNLDDLEYELIGKITFSTDPKLRVSEDYKLVRDSDHMSKISKPLPQPSQDFIKGYCEQGGIDEVDVEYEPHHNGNFVDDGKTHATSVIWKPKLNPDNTVITHSIEEKMYSREEMVANIHEFCVHNVIPEDNETFKSIADEWIKENL